jgi:hypothetical protein
MKRSEAVDNIACVLVANAPYVQAIDVWRIAEISEEIMKDLETRTGMLPPKVITLDLGDCHRFECKWEPETEGDTNV